VNGCWCRQKIYSASSRGNSDKVTPQERVEEIQAESSDKLEEALDGVEENLDAQANLCILSYIKNCL
jgi:hypothetical protein